MPLHPPHRQNHNPQPVAARVLRLLSMVEDGLLIGLLSMMILLAAGQVILRNVFGISLVWGDPGARTLVLWVGLLGAMSASRTHKHISMDVLSRWLPDQARRLSLALIGLFTASVCGVVAYHAGRFVAMDYEAGLLAFAAVPAWVVELILPLGFTIMAVRYLLVAVINVKQLLTGEVKP